MTDRVLKRADQRPDTVRSILVQVGVLVFLTVVAQMIALAFGRSNEEQSFSSIVLPSVLFLSAITLPLTV